MHGPLVKRSEVTAGLAYSDYRNELRYDFYYSCAYCTITEYEAAGIRFTIDHYVPQGNTEIDVHAYENLMYACDECNLRKGNRHPPASAQEAGFRFFRPDKDALLEHFSASGVRVNHVTNTGYYTIQSLDLNRQSLRRLREYRERLAETHEYVVAGIHALRHVRIDRFPKHVRTQVLNAIKSAQEAANEREEEIETTLRDFARSPLLDRDPDAETRAKERTRELDQMKALHPGAWRTPRKAANSA
ncbi:HNH endonuclease [Phenylobacterium sp. Root700]|uniref:HNH endonuclease n=1 Tax=Phenylobacterium sp. Root700 TaxID=1736591 RepID=UPI003516880A